MVPKNTNGVFKNIWELMNKRHLPNSVVKFKIFQPFP